MTAEQTYPAGRPGRTHDAVMRLAYVAEHVDELDLQVAGLSFVTRGNLVGVTLGGGLEGANGHAAAERLLDALGVTDYTVQRSSAGGPVMVAVGSVAAPLLGRFGIAVHWTIGDDPEDVNAAQLEVLTADGGDVPTAQFAQVELVDRPLPVAVLDVAALERDGGDRP